jgi:hypothetical protein
MRASITNFRTQRSTLDWRVSVAGASPGPDEYSDFFALTNLYKSFAQAWSRMPNQICGL